MSHMHTFNIRHPVLLSLLRQLVHTQQFKFTNKAFKVYLCNLIKAFFYHKTGLMTLLHQVIVSRQTSVLLQQIYHFQQTSFFINQSALFPEFP